MQDSTEYLNALAPLIEPQAVSNWPPPAGWYILLAVILLIGLLALRNAILKARKGKYRREAIAGLGALSSGAVSVTSSQLVLEVNRILKRVAIQRFGRSEVASLSGDRWTEFLKNTSRSQPFDDKSLHLLSAGVYRSGESSDITPPEGTQLIVQSIKWVKEIRD